MVTEVYIALLALFANLVVTVVLTMVFRAMQVDEGVEPELDPLAESHR